MQNLMNRGLMDYQVSADDIADVQELQEKLYELSNEILNTQSFPIAFIALIKSTLDMIYNQCNSKKLFCKYMDILIENINIYLERGEFEDE